MVKCVNCFYYEMRNSGEGWCHRYPPTSDMFDEKDKKKYGIKNDENCKIPIIVDGINWCGEFKEKSLL